MRPLHHFLEGEPCRSDGLRPNKISFGRVGDSFEEKRRSLEGLEGDQHLEFLPGIGNLRKKCRSKSIDVGYFRDLDILELCREEQQVEYPSSQTSGTEVPRSGKPESPDKSTKEEVAALKGQVARIEDALMKFLDLQA